MVSRIVLITSISRYLRCVRCYNIPFLLSILGVRVFSILQLRGWTGDFRLRAVCTAFTLWGMGSDGVPCLSSEGSNEVVGKGGHRKVILKDCRR